MNRQGMAGIVPAGSIWNNFHTHTYRCHHAEGDVGDYAKRAAQLGMTKLGMSDHAYVRGVEDHPDRMGALEAADYVRLCRENDGRHGGVKVYCGLECDYDPSDVGFFQDYYLGTLRMDYLVGSVHVWKGREDEMDCFSNRHFGVAQLRVYTDLYVKMLESHLFTFHAHPDLFGRPIEVGADPAGWDANASSAAREILEAAQANGSVLEMNVSGAWKTFQKGYPKIIYPRWQFWEMASDYKIPVILNTDAHTLDRLNAFVDYGFELIEKYGLRRVELG